VLLYVGANILNGFLSPSFLPAMETSGFSIVDKALDMTLAMLLCLLQR